MRFRISAAVAAAALAFAGAASAQDRTEAPVGGPVPNAERTDAPSAPRSEAGRLADLERRLAEQQKELDVLKGDREAQALRGKKSTVDEKGVLAAASKETPAAGENTIEPGYDDGFLIKGRVNGAGYQVRFRARIQLDYRAYPHSSANDLYGNKPPQDEFLIRRARVGFDGTFGVFGFDLEMDPTRYSTTAPQTLPLGDFFFEYRQFDEFRLRIGHYKTPFDLEDFATSDLYLLMVERPMVVGSGAEAAPDFHPGVMAYGSLGGGVLNYAINCQNQPDSNAVFSGDPMSSARLESVFGGFGLGVGGVWLNRSGVQNSLPGLTPGQFSFFAPVSVRGWDQRYEADVSCYSGPFFAQAEFCYVTQERWRVLADHGSGTSLVTQGFSATAGWMFWGPKGDAAHPTALPFQDWALFSSDIVRKKNKRNVGMELVARAEWINIDNTGDGRRGQGGALAQPSTAANADNVRGNDCKAVTVGLNLYPIENVKFMADWVHLRVGDQARAEKAHSRFADEFLFRAQLEF